MTLELLATGSKFAPTERPMNEGTRGSRGLARDDNFVRLSVNSHTTTIIELMGQNYVPWTNGRGHEETLLVPVMLDYLLTSSDKWDLSWKT